LYLQFAFKIGMQDQTAAPISRWTQLIAQIRRRISTAAFCARHRQNEKCFTRERVLTFPVVMLLLLQKSTKAVQRHLNAFFRELWPDQEVSASAGAWTQARAKLSHTAMIELNQEVLLPGLYAPEHAAHRRTWKKHRLLGGDGSQLRLPAHPKVVEKFGEVQVANHLGQTGTTYVPARLSVVYDLLNHVGLDARVEPVEQSEVELLIAQLEQVQAGDVLIWDRGFTGFPLMAQVLARGAHFIGRCSTGSFAAAQELFRMNRAGRSRIVKLIASSAHRSQLQKLGLPTELIVRFVSLRLPSGELEVLVTSLLDESLYPTQDFLQVYDWRWNHETYHLMLKGRLDLENWTGLTEEAVHQDVQAAVLVSNIETLLSQEPQEQLTAGDPQRDYPAQVNRANSYHALKEQILDLLWSKRPLQKGLARIQRWMLHAPVSIRPDRDPPRKPQSFHRSYNFQRNVKKTVF
jgi:Transposase DDE domain